MQEGKYPEFKMPDIYPASFNPAIYCTPNRHLRKTKQKNHLWQIFSQDPYWRKAIQLLEMQQKVMLL